MKKWLQRIQETGFVEAGVWGNGQKNRPLWKLVDLGLVRFGWGPEDHMLKTQGFMQAGTTSNMAEIFHETS